MTCTCPDGFVAAFGYHHSRCPMHNSATCEGCIWVALLEGETLTGFEVNQNFYD